MSEKKVGHHGRIGDAHLALVPEVGECYPGISPVEYNVILAPAKAPDKLGAKGLILASDVTKDAMGLAAQVGRIIAASPLAFNYETWPADQPPPKIGDLVWFARYAGGLVEGIDGEEYRMIKDKDIGAVIPPVDMQALGAAKAARAAASRMATNAEASLDVRPPMNKVDIITGKVA